jgi:hypothetical protein
MRPHLVAKHSEVNKILNEAAPAVGVFWIHPKTRQLVSPHAEPVESGLHDPDMHIVDARATHRDLWNTVKDWHPQLADVKHLKYDDVPRGRVYLNTKTKNFHVYGSTEHILDPKI